MNMNTPGYNNSYANSNIPGMNQPSNSGIPDYPLYEPAMPNMEDDVMPMLPETNGNYMNGNNMNGNNMNGNYMNGNNMNGMNVAPGFGPSGDVTPALPDINQPVSPGFGPSGNVTPSLPDINQPVSPGFGPSGNVTPSLPDINQPVSPGFGPSGNVTPALPGPSGNITVIPIVPISYVRFLHAAPSTAPVDIYINGKIVARNLKYKDFTEYLRAMPGTYNISVYPTGSTVRPLLVSRISISVNSIYTVALTGTPQTLNVEVIPDRPRRVNANLAHMRFIHLSPDAPAVDVYIDNRKAVGDLTFGEVSGYLALRPGVHSLQIKVAGTDRTVLENPYMNLRKNNYYSTYIVGYVGTRPELQVLIPLEGASYLKF